MLFRSVDGIGEVGDWASERLLGCMWQVFSEVSGRERSKGKGAAGISLLSNLLHGLWNSEVQLLIYKDFPIIPILS